MIKIKVKLLISVQNLNLQNVELFSSGVIVSYDQLYMYINDEACTSCYIYFDLSLNKVHLSLELFYSFILSNNGHWKEVEITLH